MSPNMSFWGGGGSYSAWCDYLDRWVGSPLALDERPPALDKDDFDSQTWARLTMRLENALFAKVDQWSATVVRSVAHARDEFSLGRALVQARGGLRTILVLGSLPELPDLLRQQVRQQIENVITSTQQQLVDEAQRELGASPSARQLAELKLRQFRANPLTAVIGEPAPVATSSPPDLPPDISTVRRGRKILIDQKGDL